MRVFFSAGEASGDAYAAELADRLPASISIEGIGGAHLERRATLCADSRTWGAVGIMEALRVVPRVYRGMRRARKALRQGTPGLFVPIDFGYLNIKLCRYAKQAGWKVLYFVPPGSWRRNKQGRDLPSLTDAIVTPFPWSNDLLRAAGGNSFFFGHPLLEMIGEPNNDPRTDEIAVLPGSRLHEVQYNLPAIVDALLSLGVQRAAIAVAANLNPEDLRKTWRALCQDRIALRLESDRYQVLRSCRAGVICSGTATLEAAICDLPHVVVYRGSKMMEIEAKIRKPKFDYISLPNLILQRPVLAELIQHDASPTRIAAALEELFTESDAQHRQLAAFSELRKSLQPKTALTQTAALMQSMLA